MLNDIRSSCNYYSPHHSTQGGASTTPNTILHLWKSCVLNQATQYIKYVPPNQIQEIQIALNKSLLQTFSCHDPFAQPLIVNLMTDLGIPPLIYYRHLDLVRLHYRYTNLPANSIPRTLYLSRAARQQVLALPQLEAHMRDSILTLFSSWKADDPLPQPKYLYSVLKGNREKSFTRSPRSTQWSCNSVRQDLLAQAHDPPTTRLVMYLIIAGQDIYRPNLFKPTSYITLASKIKTKCLSDSRFAFSLHSKPLPKLWPKAAKQLMLTDTAHSVTGPKTKHKKLDHNLLLNCPQIPPGFAHRAN